MKGWSLDDIPWQRFDPEKVDPDLLAAVKAETPLSKRLNNSSVLSATLARTIARHLDKSLDDFRADIARHDGIYPYALRCPLARQGPRKADNCRFACRIGSASGYSDLAS